MSAWDHRRQRTDLNAAFNAMGDRAVRTLPALTAAMILRLRVDRRRRRRSGAVARRPPRRVSKGARSPLRSAARDRRRGARPARSRLRHQRRVVFRRGCRQAATSTSCSTCSTTGTMPPRRRSSATAAPRWIPRARSSSSSTCCPTTASRRSRPSCSTSTCWSCSAAAERTRREYETLLRAAGLDLIRVTQPSGGVGVLEAKPSAAPPETPARSAWTSAAPARRRPVSAATAAGGCAPNRAARLWDRRPRRRRRDHLRKRCRISTIPRSLSPRCSRVRSTIGPCPTIAIVSWFGTLTSRRPVRRSMISR